MKEGNISKRIGTDPGERCRMLFFCYWVFALHVRKLRVFTYFQVCKAVRVFMEYRPITVAYRQAQPTGNASINLRI